MPSAPDHAPSSGPSRLAAIHAAMRRLDPGADVALDPDNGRMKVLTVLPPDEVMRVLVELGEVAELLDEDADTAAPGGGGCGCGCSHR
ncbi:hypothetical protein B1992_04040 [Pseudoxanthomonas broegbernensis]|uniref:Uncharacterized protein n=1 Tax=Pseudoxanthomonas broegbernensis TaxID=83619 RepID=A0A7V8GNP4_9GAMM|nr:hypothetical protein [Pseudoxanthomonas broegbernensis]KAF1687167.1 hypothetical protein B1992_04040 [Pseudoxanthomonas broegbernensis]MBB6065853.1 hypothetical protein [Pseudoxanthomonas broegbernensis]